MVRAIVGGNWGDEGKGKMTDLLAGSSDVVVRFQGGANAGHTIINEYGKFALHLLPSGVFQKNVTNIVGQGVALNLEVLFNELDNLKMRSVPEPLLLVSDRAQLVMPYHILLDQLEELRLGHKCFGSTQSGIAPFYSDKYMKIGIQVSDLFDDQVLHEKIKANCAVKNELLESIFKGIISNEEARKVEKDVKEEEDGFIKQTGLLKQRQTQRFDAGRIFKSMIVYRERIKPMVTDVTHFLHQSLKAGDKILLEGQLGALKDPDNGIYPFTTSSSPLAGFGAVGAGIPPYAIKEVITVTKAYSSCVGAGAFVSEVFGQAAEKLRSLGGDCGEYGATTGRPRRMGWFDVVATKYGCLLQGTTAVALTNLDVLGYLKRIPVCIAYQIEDQIITEFPVTTLLNKAKPVLIELDGWQCDIRHIRKFEDLPIQAKQYVEWIESQLGYPIRYISNGPDRQEIILR